MERSWIILFLTMCLETAAKVKSPDLNYISDFVQTVMDLCTMNIHQKELCNVNNAGGANPLWYAAVFCLALKASMDLKIAVVTGDGCQHGGVLVEYQ
jgi:hypothetical protein